MSAIRKSHSYIEARAIPAIVVMMLLILVGPLIPLGHGSPNLAPPSTTSLQLNGTNQALKSNLNAGGYALTNAAPSTGTNGAPLYDLAGAANNALNTAETNSASASAAAQSNAVYIASANAAADASAAQSNAAAASLPVAGTAVHVTGLTVAAGKTLTASNSIAIAGTDGATINVGTGGTLDANAFNTNAVTVAASTLRSGATSPNSVVTGNVSDLYLSTAGGASTTLWIKESGAGTSTGWVAK